MEITFLLGLVAILEFLIIVILLKRRVVKPDTLLPISVTKLRPKFDLEYQLNQVNNWTKLYFSNHHHSKKEVGKMYERYVGYLKEQMGYLVEYHGIHFKHKDSGIDLICRKNKEILLVQCKRLSQWKEIHEDILNKLRGSLEEFKAKNQEADVTAEVCSTAKFADDALTVANIHNIKTSIIAFDGEYPSLKCNVSHNGVKHFFPPYHPFYDKITIDSKLGECYCRTAEEAYKLGFLPAKIPLAFLWTVKKKVGVQTIKH